jgi:transcriptional regulator with XRE-family HTH domain
MELGKQIKKIRNEMSLSQDALAEKIYVSRQTISNWENDKSYPDVNSLILLSEVFETSIDILIKGDVEIMKEQVKNEDRG